jgi:hypothetical protein
VKKNSDFHWPGPQNKKGRLAGMDPSEGPAGWAV